MQRAIKGGRKAREADDRRREEIRRSTPCDKLRFRSSVPVNRLEFLYYLSHRRDCLAITRITWHLDSAGEQMQDRTGKREAQTVTDSLFHSQVEVFLPTKSFCQTLQLPSTS